jgi:hypothetical protein
VIGTGDVDELVGTPESDTICAFGGADTISGAGGDDTIWPEWETTRSAEGTVETSSTVATGKTPSLRILATV